MPISNCCPACLIKQLVPLFILSMFKNKGNSFCSLGPRNNPGLALITESWRILSESCSRLPALLLAISIKPSSGEHRPLENGRQQHPLPSTAPAGTAGGASLSRTPFPLGWISSPNQPRNNPLYLYNIYLQATQIAMLLFKILQWLPVAPQSKS